MSGYDNNFIRTFVYLTWVSQAQTAMGVFYKADPPNGLFADKFHTDDGSPASCQSSLFLTIIDLGLISMYSAFDGWRDGG
jgi:hypothetical protein